MECVDLGFGLIALDWIGLWIQFVTNRRAKCLGREEHSGDQGGSFKLKRLMGYCSGLVYSDKALRHSAR